MPFKWSKDSTFKMDNASAALTDLTSTVNQASVQATLAMLDDTTLNDTASSVFPGLSGATIPVNGFVNSTTEGILGPLLGVRTSVSKTVQWGNGLKFYYGEAYLSDVQMSGNVGEMLAFSFTATIDGAITRTSVTQA